MADSVDRPLYGDVLYYGTSMMEDYYHDRSYSPPEGNYYLVSECILDSDPSFLIPAGEKVDRCCL